ncbi:hypothetical protein EDD21DRAFT_393853 [Dissophora ornata]|nr:hypothetical protein EDD21DRAFT_393853 [Dissophora ornata]
MTELIAKLLAAEGLVVVVAEALVEEVEVAWDVVVVVTVAVVAALLEVEAAGVLEAEVAETVLLIDVVVVAAAMAEAAKARVTMTKEVIFIFARVLFFLRGGGFKCGGYWGGGV